MGTRDDSPFSSSAGSSRLYMSCLFTSKPARLVLLPALAQRFARRFVGRHHFQHALEGAVDGCVAQVDHQRASGRVDVGRGDQHRGQFVVLVAGDLVRDVGVVVEFPQQLVELLRPARRRAPGSASTVGVVGLARQFADQQQRLLQEARLGDQVEIGARHVAGFARCQG